MSREDLSPYMIISCPSLPSCSESSFYWYVKPGEAFELVSIEILTREWPDLPGVGLKLSLSVFQAKI